MTTMSNRRQLLLVVGAAIAVGVFIATVPTFRGFFDLGVYRGAVHDWLIDGGDLYDYRYNGTEYGFTYPPFAALVFSPLAWTSWPLAIVLSLALNAAAGVLLLRWYVFPALQRRGWTAWSVKALAFLALIMFEPARDTFSFGQINLLLLLLVCVDLRALENGRLAGFGIGLAAAIKLTPAVFIGYLIVTRQYRAAGTAIGTAAGATLLMVLIAPDESRRFWTQALWDTSRVGKTEYVSNQSLHGVVARMELPSTWWLAGVALVLAFWWLVVRAVPDHRTGFALTGIVACLISPITWVHHLVWLLPAMFLLLDRALTQHNRRLLILVGFAYFILGSSLVWLWWAHPYGWTALPGSNAYVWISIGLLVAVDPRVSIGVRRRVKGYLGRV